MSSVEIVSGASRTQNADSDERRVGELPSILMKKQQSRDDTIKSKNVSIHYTPETEAIRSLRTTNDKPIDSPIPMTPETDNNDSKNWKSLKYYTREVLPKMDHYRNLMSLLRDRGNGYNQSRPTLDELHGIQTSISFDNSIDKDGPASDHLQLSNEENYLKTQVKFGWIKGVLIRNLLNIWGVILFLRLSWVAAQAGIIQGSLVILLASICTTLTAMSMSAICTNGQVKSGGTYYMISRSLGPEIGGAIGMIFSLANAVAVAMYTVGFAETLHDLLSNKFGVQLFQNGTNDVRLISCLTLVVLLGIVFIGTEWEAKTQIILLCLLLLAMVDFFIGSLIGPQTNEQLARGYIGWNLTLIEENLYSSYRDGHNFFSVFSIYFPAATGILAGANISGDLKNPSHAIPLGTFLAIVITTITYLLFHFTMAANVLRDAGGLENVAIDFFTGSNYTVGSIGRFLVEEIGACSKTDQKCSYGLMNNYQIVEMMSFFGPLIYVGIFAAALSSALASLVSGPKVFQALCNDNLLPYISVFGKGYGPGNGEPQRAYLLAFVIAMICCLLGELNIIAPIISNFFLVAYALINFSCFHASFSKSPGFRPSFRFYNQWISLGSSFLITFVMFITDWFTALLTFSLIFLLFMWIQYMNPEVNWGSSTQAQTYRSALNSVQKLNTVLDHVKNFRPQILLLSGKPFTRPDFVHLASLITKNTSSLLICGHVQTLNISERSKQNLISSAYQWLNKNNIRAFFNLVQDTNFYQGASSLIQLSGLGKLRPNIVMLGFKNDWQHCSGEELLNYFQTIHFIFEQQLSIVIVHLLDDQKLQSNNMSEHQTKDDSFLVNNNNPISIKQTPDSKSLFNERYLGKSLFLETQPKGSFIDVWWLYDDGGLTLLLPYILKSYNQQWHDCHFRIFAVSDKKSELDIEQRTMAALLSKFRIDYSNVIFISDILKTPSEKSRQEFRKLIEKYLRRPKIADDEVTINDFDISTISKLDLEKYKNKTNRHLRLRELLLENSEKSKLIVITLPVPRKDDTPAPLYMAWLEMLTKGMPPMLLIRGNQTNVLTFYS